MEPQCIACVCPDCNTELTDSLQSVLEETVRLHAGVNICAGISMPQFGLRAMQTAYEQALWACDRTSNVCNIVYFQPELRHGARHPHDAVDTVLEYLQKNYAEPIK